MRIVDLCEVLLPERLHAPDGPRVVGVREVNRVKVHQRARAFVRLVFLGFCDKPREHHHLPHLLWRLRVAQARRGDALLAQLCQGELAHVADHHARRLARLAREKGEPLVAARVTLLGRQHHGHSKGGLAIHPGRLAGEKGVQIVHRGLVQRRPPLVRRVVEGYRRLRRRQHHEARADGADVVLLARPRGVQLARDVRKVPRRCHGLALRGAEDAHVADAARARGERVAAQAARTGAVVEEIHHHRWRHPWVSPRVAMLKFHWCTCASMPGIRLDRTRNY